METSDESTNKVKRIDDTLERPPQPRPIPSVLHRNADSKPAPAFTWPLSTPKPAPQIPRTPVGAKVAVPAVVRPTAVVPARAPRGTDAPPARVEAKPIAPTPVARVEAKPVAPTPVARVEAKPIAPTPMHVEAKPIAPVVEIPAPVARIEAKPIETPAPVTAPSSFGSGMLQARGRRAKPSVAREEHIALPAAPAFGAGMLQARTSGTKKLVIAFVVAAVTVAGFALAMRGGSHPAPAPTTTQQP